MTGLLSLSEVAARLGVSRTTAWRLIRSGELPSVRITDTLRRVDADDLERWIDERRERAEPTGVVSLPQRAKS